MSTQGIANRNDVLAIEAQGVPEDLPVSTYEMICRGAAIDPSAPALSFFMTADCYRDAECWTYGELVRDITRTANAFTRLGATSQSVIAYVLPNLPETHFVIWGGQAAGITFAVNPLLEGEALADLLNAAGATILVTLAPFPGTDLWQRCTPSCTGCRHSRTSSWSTWPIACQGNRNSLRACSPAAK